MKRLGLLITSPDDLDSVLQLTRAARAKGVDLYIHLTGDGVNAAGTPHFQDLRNIATITICRQSAEQQGLPADFIEHLGDLLTGPEHITAMVQRCDRSIVF